MTQGHFAELSQHNPAEPERGRVWEPCQGTHQGRVGEAGLSPAEPERGRVWEPFQGSHQNQKQV